MPAVLAQAVRKYKKANEENTKGCGKMLESRMTENFLDELGTNKRDRIIWYSELPTDEERAMAVLTNLKLKLNYGVALFKKIQDKVDQEGPLVAMVNNWSIFADDLDQLLEQGIKNDRFQLQNRILKSLERLIASEKANKDIPPDNVITLPTNAVMSEQDKEFESAEKQGGLLDLWELEALKKTKGFLDSTWGTPIKELSQDEANKKIKKKTPIDVEPED